jgi:hypothetical protein
MKFLEEKQYKEIPQGISILRKVEKERKEHK